MGKKNRIPSGLKHSFWSVLDAAVYPAVYMAMVPLLMNGLGAAAFGLWIVLNTLMTTLQLFNLNIGLTTVRNVSAAVASGNHAKVSDIINALLRITFLLLLLVAAAGLIIAFLFPLHDIPGLQDAQGVNITFCIILTAIISGIKYFDQVFQNVLKGLEQFKKAAVLNICNRGGLLAVNVALALSHATVQDLLWANIVFACLYLLVHFIVVARALPYFKLSITQGKLHSKSLFKYSMWPWLQSIIVVIAFQTDRFWVTAFGGLHEVSAYGLVATMFNHIHMIFLAMAVWMLPRISGMATRGEDPEKMYRQVRGALMGVTIVSLLFFHVCAPLLFPLWVGLQTYLEMAVFIQAFIAFELLFAHTIMPFLYLNAAGKEKLATLVTLGYSLGCYACMVTGLLVFKDSLFLIHGMTLSMCISMPLVNRAVRRKMTGTADYRTAFTEMIPFYLAILLLYAPQAWMSLLILPLLAAAFYRYYLSGIIDLYLWKQPLKL